MESDARSNEQAEFVGHSVYARLARHHVRRRTLRSRRSLRSQNPRSSGLSWSDDMHRKMPVLLAAIRATRPHQWTKNLLLFIPVTLAHSITFATIFALSAAFISFSLCAAATYILNDLLDVESDRRHAFKCHRPFASGRLSERFGRWMAISLSVGGLACAALTLPPPFVVTLLLYLLATSCYSAWLKRQPILDVLVLAGLYTLRIVAGGIVTGVHVSEWLMAFSVFFFISLAFAKRHAELSRVASEGGESPAGRGYLAQDLVLITTVGPTCGCLAVLILALYIQSDAMRQIYLTAWPLWLLCPLVLYWVMRVWLLAGRGQLYEDPLIFALRDRVSYVLGVLAVALVLLASVGTGSV